MQPQTTSQDSPSSNTIIFKASLIYCALHLLVSSPLIAAAIFLSRPENSAGGLIMLPIMFVVLPLILIVPPLVTRGYLKNRGIPGATKIALLGLIGSFIVFPFGTIALMYVGAILSRKNGQAQVQDATDQRQESRENRNEPVAPSAPQPPQS